VDVLAGAVIVAGTNVLVRPVTADAVRSTGLLKPLRAVTVILDVLEPPAVTVREVGLEEIVKSGPTTVKLIPD